MATPLLLDDARQSLTAHVAANGAEIREKYGNLIDGTALSRLLADRAFVRYPCEIQFDASPLESGECAHPVAKGTTPEEGFTIFVHPVFLTQPDRVANWVLYQLVAVNYGGFASSDVAEIFGATALGIARDDYYRALCEMADALGGERNVYLEAEHPCSAQHRTDISPAPADEAGDNGWRSGSPPKCSSPSALGLG